MHMGEFSATQRATVDFKLNVRLDAYGEGVHSVGIAWPNGVLLGNFRTDIGFGNGWTEKWIQPLVYRACVELLRLATKGEKTEGALFAFEREEPPQG